MSRVDQHKDVCFFLRDGDLDAVTCIIFTLLRVSLVMFMNAAVYQVSFSFTKSLPCMWKLWNRIARDMSPFLPVSVPLLVGW